MKNKFPGAAFDEIIKKECKWYRRLWKKIFPPKPLTLEKLNELVRKLKENNEL